MLNLLTYMAMWQVRAVTVILSRNDSSLSSYQQGEMWVGNYNKNSGFEKVAHTNDNKLGYYLI